MIPFITLAVTIALLVVWAGGIYPAPLYLAAGLLAAGTVLTALTQPRRLRIRHPWLHGLALAAGAWILCTALPLPDQIESALACPRRAEAVAAARRGVQRATALGLAAPFAPRFSLSLNRAGTLRFLLLFSGMVSAAWLAAAMPRRYKHFYLVFLGGVAVVVAGGGLVGCYAIDPGGRIWWTFPTVAKRAYACFVNPNHFGAFLAMLTPAIVSLAVWDFREFRWERSFLWCLALAVVVAGVVASESRGAYLLQGAAFLGIGLLSFSRRRARTGIIIAGMACIGFLMLGTLTTGAMDAQVRTLKNPHGYGRIEMWRHVLRIVPDFPVFGLGPDGFRTVSPMYLSEIRGNRFAHHTESVWLQILVDGGLVGTLLALGLILAWGTALVQEVRRWRRHRSHSPVFVATLGALPVMGLHFCYDNPFDVPIYCIVAAAFCGLLFDAEPLERSPRRVRDYLTAVVRTPAVVGAIAFGLVLTMWFRFGVGIGQRDRYEFAAAAPPEALVRNLTWCPTYWANWYWLGRAAVEAGRPKAARFGFDCLARAAALAPHDPDLQRTVAALRAAGYGP